MYASPAHPRPTIGRIVLYRSRDGVDMPAIITALVNPGGTDVHLHAFPPPGASPDVLSHEWGTEQAKNPSRPACQSWRWPEHT